MRVAPFSTETRKQATNTKSIKPMPVCNNSISYRIIDPTKKKTKMSKDLQMPDVYEIYCNTIASFS